MKLKQNKCYVFMEQFGKLEVWKLRSEKRFAFPWIKIKGSHIADFNTLEIQYLGELELCDFMGPENLTYLGEL